uniref:Glutathione S-transferase n=1 Tax=Steinernema glaseri TaxID=37863 RepID=A0A1I8AK59_9BILA
MYEGLTILGIIFIAAAPGLMAISLQAIFKALDEEIPNIEDKIQKHLMKNRKVLVSGGMVWNGPLISVVDFCAMFSVSQRVVNPHRFIVRTASDVLINNLISRRPSQAGERSKLVNVAS